MPISPRLRGRVILADPFLFFMICTGEIIDNSKGWEDPDPDSQTPFL